MNFTGIVGREQLVSVWPQVAPILIKAIRVYNEHTLEEIFESLLNRERQLWVGFTDRIESVLITQIINEPDKYCFLELCAGRGVVSIPFLEKIEEWARGAGCKHVELSGRLGWKRALKDYRVKKVILKKDL